MNWPRPEYSANLSRVIVKIRKDSDAFSASSGSVRVNNLTSSWRHEGTHRVQARYGLQRDTSSADKSRIIEQIVSEEDKARENALDPSDVAATKLSCRRCWETSRQYVKISDGVAPAKERILFIIRNMLSFQVNSK